MIQVLRKPTSAKNILLLSLPVITALVLSGCGAFLAPNAVYGSQNIQSEERDLTPFTGISLTNIGSVTIQQGDKPSLTVRADDNILPLLTSEVENGVLTLSVKPLTLPINATIEYKITVAALDHIDLSGAGEITANAIQSDEISVSVSGVGSIALEALEADKLAINISGAGGLTGSGTVNQLTVDLSGAGSCDVEQLVSERASVSVSGAGSVVVHATETLTADVSGLGSISYVGEPALTQNVSGVGSISKK